MLGPGGFVCGSLWIRNHLQYSIFIIGRQKGTSGVACLDSPGVILLGSLKSVRKQFYQTFFVVQ